VLQQFSSFLSLTVLPSGIFVRLTLDRAKQQFVSHCCFGDRAEIWPSTEITEGPMSGDSPDESTESYLDAGEAVSNMIARVHGMDDSELSAVGRHSKYVAAQHDNE
jgi:hypothetical protein